jgi:hypothetical protein
MVAAMVEVGMRAAVAMVAAAETAVAMVAPVAEVVAMAAVTEATARTPAALGMGVVPVTTESLAMVLLVQILGLPMLQATLASMLLRTPSATSPPTIRQ